MNRPCLYCLKHPVENTIICLDCRTKFYSFYTNQSAILAENFKVLSLFRYEDTVRDFILKAKAEGNYYFLQYLVECFCNDESIKLAIEQAHAIMPVPSSLWGRLRGKFDLAYIFSKNLAKQNHKTFLKPPFKTYWRMNKRAFIEDKQIKHSFVNMTLPSNNAEQQDTSRLKLFIIDDIITTGFSLLSLASYFEEYDIRFITFASAIKNI